MQAKDCDFVQFNKCQSCESRFAFTVGSDESCSFLCPNREVNYEGSGSSVIRRNCALKICPENFPYKSSYGNCFSKQEEADEDIGNFNEKNVNNDSILSGSGLETNCPSDRPLKRWNNTCFPCHETKAILLDSSCNIEENCEDICPNRTILYWVGGNVPSIPNCPLEKPLMDDEGICYACDAPVDIVLRWNGRLCERFCPHERRLEMYKCVLIKKP